MIDLNKALKEFKNYLKDYDLNDPKIKLKVVHTYGVMELSEYIAQDLNLDLENVKLAKLIALLHDITRFEQLKQYGIYEDYSTDNDENFMNMNAMNSQNQIYVTLNSLKEII